MQISASVNECVYVRVCVCTRVCMYMCVLVRVTIAMKRYHDHENSYKNIYFWLADNTEVSLLTSRQEAQGMQADMVIKKSLIVLHPDMKEVGNESNTEPLASENLKTHT